MKAFQVLVFALVVAARTSVAASFAIQSIQPTTNGGFILTWPTEAYRLNQIMYKDSLIAPWQDLPGAGWLAGPNPSILSWTDQPPTNVIQRFYRIKVKCKVLLSLVLDRSGSMNGNGGASALSPAVSTFIDYFDDRTDFASMISFSSAASTDMTMRQPFRTDVKNGVNALVFNGWTCTERGLTNGLAENESVVILPDEHVLKVIVFFSDGMANTWYYNFNCGPRNIAPDRTLYDPNTGAGASAGCTIPNPITSIDGATAVDTTGFGSGSCVSMTTEAQKRAEAIAYLARSQGNFIFVVGLGDPNAPGECSGAFPVLNSEFLKNLANTTNSATYNPNQPSGDYAIATNSAALQQVFQEIASKIISQSP